MPNVIVNLSETKDVLAGSPMRPTDNYRWKQHHEPGMPPILQRAHIAIDTGKHVWFEVVIVPSETPDVEG